jgi:hypothetical protein
VQSGLLVNIGNVRVVGMSLDEVQDNFKLRFGNDGRIYMWPQDIIDQTINAYTTSVTSPTGYAGDAPSGRYFAPANGPDCIEVAPGFGDCGTGDLVVTGPVHQQYDLAISKRISLVGRAHIELRAEALNVFNHVNFSPNDGVGGTNLNDYEVGGLIGTNQSRIIQLVGRISF